MSAWRVVLGKNILNAQQLKKVFNFGPVVISLSKESHISMRV